MTGFSRLFLSALLAVAWVSPAFIVASDPKRYMVKYKDEDQQDSFLKEVLQYAYENEININITKWDLLSILVENETILELLRNRSEVEYVEEDNLMKVLWMDGGIENEEKHDDVEFEPYGIEMVQANQLWDVPLGDDAFTVCVVDTGMDLGHRDLPSLLENNVSGTNTESGDWYLDGGGHGTHCAGTIGAVGDNGYGVVGINKNPNTFYFHIGKGLGDEGTGQESATMAAVQGCVDNGAKIVSMSLGSAFGSRSGRNFYRDMWNQGILVIAAAGNGGNTGNQYPAAYPHVMSVAAVGSLGLRPSFSQCNNQVEITAPGVHVLSTIPGGFGVSSGTSMACPHVAGVAAQVWSRFPECSNAQIRNVLLRTAKHVGNVTGCSVGYGSGLVQAKAAYDMLAAEGCAAGGDAVQEPVGGCEQNPDYVKEEHPNRDYCSTPAPPMSWWLILIIVVACVVVVGLIGFVAYYFYRTRTAASTQVPAKDDNAA